MHMYSRVCVCVCLHVFYSADIETSLSGTCPHKQRLQLVGAIQEGRETTCDFCLSASPKYTVSLSDICMKNNTKYAGTENCVWELPF